MSRTLINEIEELIDYKDKYTELLYAVARKFPNETRHETALKYINDAERGDSYKCSAASNDKEV